MTKLIVTTTINPPTEALTKFSELEDFQLVVIGDLKTPHEEFSKINCLYLHPEVQEKKYPALSNLLGWNTIERRNIGFLTALEMGGEIIATVDDDNVPLEFWGQNLIVGKDLDLPQHSAPVVFDPLSVTNYPHLWHRGYPIQLLKTRREVSTRMQSTSIDVEAQFWNGDPDIDAICRMEHFPDCEFDDQAFPFTSDPFSPFNSQNTFMTRDALKNYFMFPFVGRMDDIWGSYVLEAKGFKVGYSRASVRQVRNQHDLTRDFELEIEGYINSLRLVEALAIDPDSIRDFIPERSWEAYLEYLNRASEF